jgi:hypothetical protein
MDGDFSKEEIGGGDAFKVPEVIKRALDAVGSPVHQLTLLAFGTRWTCRVCPLPLANGMALPTISTTGFLTVSIPKRL